MKPFWTLALALLAGCTFHRAVTNPWQAELDTAWIVPGETTFEQVIDRFGMPPMVQGVNGYSSDALHYVSVSELSGKLEAGYIVTPTFERSRSSYTDDTLIAFDERGKVKLVSRTQIRPGFASDRPQVEVLDLRGRP